MINIMLACFSDSLELLSWSLISMFVVLFLHGFYGILLLTENDANLLQNWKQRLIFIDLSIILFAVVLGYFILWNILHVNVLFRLFVVTFTLIVVFRLWIFSVDVGENLSINQLPWKILSRDVDAAFLSNLVLSLGGKWVGSMSAWSGRVRGTISLSFGIVQISGVIIKQEKYWKLVFLDNSGLRSNPWSSFTKDILSEDNQNEAKKTLIAIADKCSKRVISGESE